MRDTYCVWALGTHAGEKVEREKYMPLSFVERSPSDVDSIHRGVLVDEMRPSEPKPC